MIANGTMKKSLVSMVVLLVVLFGGLFGYAHFRNVQAAAAFASYRPPAVPVTVSRAELQEMPRTLSGIGTLEAIRQVTIAPEVDGRITALHFQPGAAVRAGQPLVQLNDAPERGDLQRLKAQARLARINLERAQRLVTLAISQSELDAQQAALDQVEADIAKTEALIAQKLVRASFDGVLGVRRVHLGQYLKPGDAIVTLTDLDALYVNLTVPEQNSAQLAKGQTVNFTVDAQPGKTFSAKIVAVEPQIGVDTRSIRLQASADNPQHLLTPGMFAHASLVLPPEPKVLTVPEIAVDYTIHGDSVYVVRKARDGVLRVTRALVKPGARVGDRVVIGTGLDAGALVVTTGQLKLQDGAEVSVVNSTTLSDAAGKQGALLQ